MGRNFRNLSFDIGFIVSEFYGAYILQFFAERKMGTVWCFWSLNSIEGDPFAIVLSGKMVYFL
jgi:hypothetical protein